VEFGKDEKAREVNRIGKYDVVEVLGRGGMGVVYRAIDKQLGREVAIKTLTQGVADDPEMLTRFYEEGRKTGRLKHPHIVTVYDLGEDNGIPYIVMERVEGDPLDKVIRSEAPFSMMDRLRIMEEVCSALGYAHTNNVIHRDVKPANIFVQPDGKAKLLDFGIARLERRSQELSLTRAGHIIGTIPYMAPERLRDKFVDGRSDIFSVGVVLHQLITGQLPFSGEDYVLMQKILNEPNPPLSSFCKNCPPGLEEIVDRALAKSADDRYQTAEEMASDLTSVIEELRAEQVVELLPEARRLVEAQEFTRARTVLQKLLKVQSKHTEARELLGEIQRRLVQRQRDERLYHVRQQAEDALDKKDFDQSLQILKDGLELDPASSELLALRERVQQEKKKQGQIDEYLRQVETARRRGDFKSAMASAQEALKVDKTNSKIIALCNYLAAEAEQAQRKAQAKTLLDSVRRQLDARYCDKALELLRKVEELDPADPEVQLLIGDANAGVEQIRRQELIARLEEQVSLATTLDQVQRCAQAIQDAIASLPSESALFRLSAQVNRRLKEFEQRRLVEDTFQTCRDLRPREALEVVRKARQSLPGDERLMSLEALLTERLQQQSVDERRAEYLLRARDALKNSQYESGIQVLEACQEERIANAEVLALLDFARNEEAEQRRQKLRRSNLETAQTLVNEGNFEGAIVFLEKTLEQSEDAALRLLLERALSARQAYQRKVDAPLASAGKLAQARRTEEAIQLLKMQPPDVLRAVRVQTAIVALEDELKLTLFRMTGRAYALLETDLPAGHAMMQRVAAASDESSAAAVLAGFSTREQACADRAVAEAVRTSEILLRNRDKAGMDELVHRTEGIANWASPQAKSDWQNHVTRMNKKGLLGRIRS
jgi:eukaryotic-like serine/threonine-protein kinase